MKAAKGMMYTPTVTNKAPITELIGPKKGIAKAKNQCNATTGIRTRIRINNLLVWTPTAFSQTKNTGFSKMTNVIPCTMNRIQGVMASKDVFMPDCIISTII